MALLTVCNLIIHLSSLSITRPAILFMHSLQKAIHYLESYPLPFAIAF